MLNKQQQAAVDHIGSPLCIYAGPGTGKTLVLQKKYEKLIQEGIHPAIIHGITFTKSAANELIMRISGATGLDPGIINIGTFHSAALKIILNNRGSSGIEETLKIVSPELQITWLYEITEQLIIHNEINRDEIQNIQKCISRKKKYQDEFDNIHPTEIYASKIYPHYQQRLKNENGIDFDDMLIKASQFIANSYTQKHKYQQIYKYILVDEAQDMDRNQYNFIKQLTTHNTTIVGDDDQAIFKFAGADHTLMNQFINEFNAKTITLSTNYRSTETIIRASQYLIKHNEKRTEKPITGVLPEGPKITMIESNTYEEECYRIIESINETENTGILYRMNGQSETIETIFQRKSIPYKPLEKRRFHEYKEIKLALAILTLSHYNDENAFRIVAESRPTVGPKTIDKYIRAAKFYNKTYLDACAIPLKPTTQSQRSELIGLKTNFHSQQNLTPIERAENLIDTLILTTKETEKIRIRNFKQSLKDWQGSIQEFIAHIRNQEININTKIQLATLHKSKGMEFDHVILIGFNQGIIPLSGQDTEEERRLAYVGLTRAKERITISYNSRKASEFLYQIPQEYLI